MKWIVTLFVALCLASCKPSPISGYVVEKIHKPSYSSVVYNAALKMPQVIIHDEEWVVYISDSLGVHCRYVDKVTFDRLSVGEFVNLED